VEIVLVAQNGKREESRRYVLHRLYLAQCSAWFEDVLGFGDNASVMSSASGATTDGLKRLRFELDRARGEEMPMLILKVSACQIVVSMLTITSQQHHS
jgi:hypothetical protein